MTTKIPACWRLHSDLPSRSSWHKEEELNAERKLDAILTVDEPEAIFLPQDGLHLSRVKCKAPGIFRSVPG